MNKLEAQKIATRYAKALYEAAAEQNELSGVLDDVQGLQKLTQQSPELLAYFSNPLITVDEKTQLVSEKLAPQLKAKSAQNVVKLLGENQRLDLLSEILEAYIARQNKADGIAYAEVIAPVDLPEATLNRLRQTLEQMYQLKQVNLTVTQDPEILAGAIVRIRDKVFDGSYKSKLEQVRQHAR